jgi:SnoaL-like domain
MHYRTTRAHTPGISDAGDILGSERLARRWFSVVEERAFDQLGELVDPSVLLVSKVRPGVVVEGKDDFVRFVQDTLADSLYEAVVTSYHALDDHRVVVEGRIRWIDDDRVIRDDPVMWAMEFRDGLLVRFIPARTLVEAETILGVAST